MTVCVDKGGVDKGGVDKGGVAQGSGMGAKREETVTLFPAIVACICLLAAIKALILFCASEWVDLMAGDSP